MRRKIVLFLILTFAFSASARKTNCSRKELDRQDCRLTVGSYNLRLLKNTVAWDDGTWKTVDDLPLKEEAVQWEKATFDFLNGWPILQLWIWDSGVGETKVQSLHWYVADAEKRRLTVLAEGVVRKRHGRIADAMEKHELKATKNGGLEWTLKAEKKLIQRVH